MEMAGIVADLLVDGVSICARVAILHLRRHSASCCHFASMLSFCAERGVVAESTGVKGFWIMRLRAGWWK